MSILCALASQRQGKLTSPHTREMQASATMPSHLAGNYRAFIDLEGFDTQPSSSHGEAYKQWELTGLWTLWENMTPTPQAAMSGIHRGNGAWQSPHCPTACGGKVRIPRVLLLGMNTAASQAPPQTRGLDWPLSSLTLHSPTGVHMCCCHGYQYFPCTSFHQHHFFLFHFIHC